MYSEGGTTLMKTNYQKNTISFNFGPSQGVVPELQPSYRQDGKFICRPVCDLYKENIMELPCL